MGYRRSVSIAALGVVGVLAAQAIAAGGPTIKVSPGSVRVGQIVRVYGVVPGCASGNEVTLISAAFSHAHDFAGLPAVFARVGAHSAYSVRTRIPVARRPGVYRITGRCGGGNLGVAASLRLLAAPMPCQVPETDRHHIFNVDLDRDRQLERIDVFNFDGGGSPMTGFMVCDRVGGRLVRGQLKYTFTSPGARDSGLRQAWVGDFNRDGRYEIVIRDFITPSAGELLTILRQRSRVARTFVLLQRIPGDRVALHPSAHGRATISVFLKATHTRDGRTHTERWTWSTQRGRWACSSQCGFR